MMSAPTLQAAVRAAPPTAYPDAPRRLRIAYVVHDYHRAGGHARYVAELARRFKHDHEVHVFASVFDEPEPAGIHFHRVLAWRRNVLTAVLTFALPATWMTRGHFDIVHAQGFCGLRQNVVTAHICQRAWSDAVRRHIGRPGWRKRIFEAVAARLEQFTFRPAGAERFIAVSERMRRDLATHYGCSARVRVVYHGVDTDTFHPRQRARWSDEIRGRIGLAIDACVALYVGDLQKALPAAVRALARVPELILVCVSRSPAEPYRALIEREGVADRVRLLPATCHVERYYAAADLFLFPTLYDSFGLVVTEAMASGLPVVCGSAAGAAELIEDGVSGLIVDDAWNPAALAGAMSRLVVDASLRRQLGEAARTRVEAHTWDRVAAQTMAVYRELTTGFVTPKGARD
jgi:UDP-glucose:(heptosyl)LPS alpha-1,3-glucosyltransferase